MCLKKYGNQDTSTSAFSRDESGQGFKVFGGYQINRNFALEGGYFNLGKFGFTLTTVPAGTLSGSIKVQASTSTSSARCH